MGLRIREGRGRQRRVAAAATVVRWQQLIRLCDFRQTRFVFCASFVRSTACMGLNDSHRQCCIYRDPSEVHETARAKTSTMRHFVNRRGFLTLFNIQSDRQRSTAHTPHYRAGKLELEERILFCATHSMLRWSWA